MRVGEPVRDKAGEPAFIDRVGPRPRRWADRGAEHIVATYRAAITTGGK